MAEAGHNEAVVQEIFKASAANEKEIDVASGVVFGPGVVYVLTDDFKSNFLTLRSLAQGYAALEKEKNEPGS